MKKLFLLILAALFVFSCGGSKKDDNNENHDDSDYDTVMPDSDDDSDTDTYERQDLSCDETNCDDDPENPDPDGEHDDSDTDTYEPGDHSCDETDCDDDPDDPDTTPDEDEPEVFDTSKVEWNGKVGTVSVTGDELRTYTLTTNAKLRESGDPHQRTVSETAGSPILRSGNTMLDALFALAITELNENKVSAISDYSMSNGDQVPCDCFETGANWHYVWTRDTAYAVHSAIAFLEPQKSKNSLKFKISARKSAAGGGNTQIVQDTGSGGSWPVSTDRIVWAIGAMETLVNLDGSDYDNFLSESYEAIKNTLEADRKAVFDPDDGLYRGEQSFLDWREQTYPNWTATNTVHIGMSKTLSTNVLYYMAMHVAASMAVELGKTEEALYFAEQADDLKNAIRSNFYLADRKTFSSMKTTFFDSSAVDKRDLLGESLAILFIVADDTQSAEIMAEYPVTEAGPAVIFPQEPKTRIYHNRAIWPFVTSYALRAAAKAGNDKFYENAFMSLVRGAAFNLSNMENFEFTTLDAWHEDTWTDFQGREMSGPVVNSKRQLWSVAGFLSMVLDSVFGRSQSLLKFSFSPKIPVNLRNTFFAGSSEIVLKNLKFKGKTFTLKILLPPKNGETRGFYVQKSLKIDGVPGFLPDSLKEGSLIEMELRFSDESGEINLVDCNADPNKCWAPLPVTIPLDPYGVTLENDRLKVSFTASENAVSYNIYRDGVKVASNVQTTSWVDENSGDHAKKSYCYSVAALNSEGWESHHSDPVCYWGPDFDRTTMKFWAGSAFDQTPNASDHGRAHFADWGTPSSVLSVPNITPTKSGTYIVTVEYGSRRPIDTGITSCNKIVRITDENNNVVMEKMVFMPHLGADNWDRWGESSFVEVELESGKTYKAEISDAFNMSYFEHFVPYTAGIGGGDDVYNRANISTLKFLLKEIKN
ncbi:hypothetical protein IKS86_02875 [bacterium]|nr:hypothetical protein [bacterium]